MTAHSVSKICSVEGCEQVARRKELCDRHYMRMYRRGTLALRHRSPLEDYADWFWLQVRPVPSTCWEWQRSKSSTGYGHARFNGRIRHAHIISWTLTYGIEPTKWILHSCDNRICVNPAHLREGSAAENTQDMIDRDRRKHCVLGPKLKTDDVVKIRVRRASGESLKSIAASFGVTVQTISFTVNRRTHRGVA